MMKEEILDGFWDFSFTGETQEYKGIQSAEYSTKMPVPGCFDVEPGYKLRRGVGIYRCFVNIGGMVKLTLDALGPKGRVYWDGKLLGEYVLPFSREEFCFNGGADGEHELCVEVDNRSDNSFDSLFPGFYDFYRHGGIYRSVKIKSLSEWDIEYVKIIPIDLSKCTVEVSIELSGTFPAEVQGEFSFDGGDKSQLEISGGSGTFILTVPDCQLWSPENPHLHRFDLRFGEYLRSVEFGMRTIKATDGQLLLNGKPLKLIGYNRHDSHPDFGYAVPEVLVKRDLELIKQQGCNFVRGSHYPQSEYVLKWCDRLGLLLWEESIGWGNSVNYLKNEDFRRRQLEQTRRMVRRSINHPCIVLQGFMNELASDQLEAKTLVAELATAIRQEDGSRPVTYASNLPMTDICLDEIDVISFNLYPGWYINDNMTDIQQFDTEGFEKALLAYEKVISTPDRINKPYIISEVGAAALPGNHGDVRWSEEYQSELAEAVFRHVLNSNRCNGVSLWIFCDTRSYNDYNAPARPRGFNNKGVLDEYRRPKMAWNLITKILKGQKK